MPLTTKVERHDPMRATIALAGSLDTATAPELEKVLKPLLAVKETRLVIFELGDLEFLSSAGIRVLLSARKSLQAREGIFAMRNLQPQIRKVFEVIQSLPGFAIFKDEAEMDTYLADLQRKVVEGGAA
jgi:anti-sigma B factor antagonist